MEEDNIQYRVVINHEEQYSIWPDYKEIPNGWRDVGVAGSKDKCLDHIEEVWTDMRPLSLRKQMEAAKANQSASNDVEFSELDDSTELSLVERLSEGRHPVEISLRPDKTVSRFKESLDRGYVHVRFTETQGGTELGFKVDVVNSKLGEADFENASGSVTLAGDLSLDFERVRCHATVSLPDLSGEGYLEPISV